MPYLAMKAHVYEPKKHIISPAWYVSEKMDGRYFFWDGGGTRGMDVKAIPWANTIKDKREFVSTGMWSSQGKVVHIPDSVSSNMPPVLCEGELWAGRKQFQTTVSKTRAYEGDWDGISIRLFNAPTVGQFCIRRIIKYLAGDVDMVVDDEIKDMLADIGKPGFENYVKWCDSLKWTDRISPIPVRTISSVMKEFGCLDTQSALNKLLSTVLEIGGEGLMLVAPWNYWKPVRSDEILKIKPFNDAEGIIIGFKTGRETDKGSTLLGKIGAYIVRTNVEKEKKVVFELSGMDHATRELPTEVADWATKHPDETIPQELCAMVPAFKRTVTFRYRELTNDGLPKEARFQRFRDED